MTIELTVLITMVVAVISVIATVAAMKHRHKTDVKEDATITATVLLKLETIGNNVAEIKTEMTSLKGDTRENRERIIKLEESSKQTHKQLEARQAVGV